jgi:hypothetical protein
MGAKCIKGAKVKILQLNSKYFTPMQENNSLKLPHMSNGEVSSVNIMLDGNMYPR